MTSELLLSIIIPNRNRRDTIIQVLQALEGQTMPRDAFEVIVVDDGSTDGSPEVLQAFSRASSLQLQLSAGRGLGAAAARNIGLQAARGEQVLFLDADTIPHPDVLALHRKWFEHFQGQACLLGRITMSEKLRNRRQGRLNDTTLPYDVLPIAEAHWQDYRAANTSLSRTLCLEVGGFDESMPAAEDTEFASRLQQKGLRFIFLGDATAVHHHPLSAEGYFCKGAVYGRAAAIWYHKAPALRPLIVRRYGVFAPEQKPFKKLQYLLRAMVVNRFSAPLLAFAGKAVRGFFLPLSDGIYRAVFRYQLRHAFRMTLKRA